MTKRKTAANRYRQCIRRSNELHLEYLDDDRLLDNYDRFTQWQLEYMLQFFTDLYDEAGYSEAIDFIMSDLAGVGVSSRDKDLERAAPAITTMLPLRALQTVAAAAELNANVLRINIAICQSLAVDGKLPATISEHQYVAACNEASAFDECADLVHLFAVLGRTLDKLVKMPVLGGLLRAMRVPAHAAGFGSLQGFLETGFATFRAIPDIDRFLGAIESRTIGIFRKIYEA